MFISRVLGKAMLLSKDKKNHLIRAKLRLKNWKIFRALPSFHPRIYSNFFRTLKVCSFCRYQENDELDPLSTTNTCLWSMNLCRCLFSLLFLFIYLYFSFFFLSLSFFSSFQYFSFSFSFLLHRFFFLTFHLSYLSFLLPLHIPCHPPPLYPSTFSPPKPLPSSGMTSAINHMILRRIVNQNCFEIVDLLSRCSLRWMSFPADYAVNIPIASFPAHASLQPQIS